MSTKSLAAKLLESFEESKTVNITSDLQKFISLVFDMLDQTSTILRSIQKNESYFRDADEAKIDISKLLNILGNDLKTLRGYAEDVDRKIDLVTMPVIDASLEKEITTQLVTMATVLTKTGDLLDDLNNLSPDDNDAYKTVQSIFVHMRAYVKTVILNIMTLPSLNNLQAEKLKKLRELTQT